MNMQDIRQMMRDGEMKTPRENLEDFIERMNECGFETVSMFPYGERDYELLPCNDIPRQALNYEHVNIVFTNHDLKIRQTISVMMTGDIWCDILPINDWAFSHHKVDYVKMFVDAIREEQLGEDA